MAKRGETQPWKMAYKWSNGRGGIVAFSSEYEARSAAETQANRLGPNGETCTAEVTYRAPKVPDHPHVDPNDGRVECQTCGKWVHLVIHSCKGVPVTPAAMRRMEQHR